MPGVTDAGRRSRGRERLVARSHGGACFPVEKSEADSGQGCEPPTHGARELPQSGHLLAEQDPDATGRRAAGGDVGLTHRHRPTAPFRFFSHRPPSWKLPPKGLRHASPTAELLEARVLMDAPQDTPEAEPHGELAGGAGASPGGTPDQLLARRFEFVANDTLAPPDLGHARAPDRDNLSIHAQATTTTPLHRRRGGPGQHPP